MALIRKICRWVLQFAAGFVILLALLVDRQDSDEDTLSEPLPLLVLL